LKYRRFRSVQTTPRHRPDGVPVEVKARVVRTAPANYGTTRVGVEILEPKENWLRLFVAWVADDQNPDE